MSTPQESKSKGPPHAKSSDDALLGAGVEEMQPINLHQLRHLAAESGRIVRIHLPQQWPSVGSPDARLRRQPAGRAAQRPTCTAQPAQRYAVLSSSVHG